MLNTSENYSLLFVLPFYLNSSPLFLQVTAGNLRVGDTGIPWACWWYWDPVRVLVIPGSREGLGDTGISWGCWWYWDLVSVLVILGSLEGVGDTGIPWGCWWYWDPSCELSVPGVCLAKRCGEVQFMCLGPVTFGSVSPYDVWFWFNWFLVFLAFSNPSFYNCGYKEGALRNVHYYLCIIIVIHISSSFMFSGKAVETWNIF